MHKLRLTKGLSYNGVVRATKEQPEVLIEEEKTYQSVMASGYFEEVAISQEDDRQGDRNTIHHSLGKVSNEEYVSSGQIEVGYGRYESAAQEEAALPEEVVEQEGISKSEKISIDSMGVEELRAYAALNGIDLSGQKKKADMIAVIKAEEKRAAEARNALRLE